MPTNDYSEWVKRTSLILLFLTLLDFTLTFYILNFFDGRELNPIVNILLANVGWIGILLFKISQIALFYIIGNKIVTHPNFEKSRVAMFAIEFVPVSIIIGYTLICLWGITQIIV